MMNAESFENGSIGRWFGTISINALYLGNALVKSSRLSRIQKDHIEKDPIWPGGSCRQAEAQRHD